jgi:colanic acid biosynthesis glycosyl transferase WcaI
MYLFQCRKWMNNGLKSPLRFVIHTQYYPPEMGAPQSRLSELAQGLAQRGYVVTVLTTMPNYPTGRLFPGYRGWVRQEMDGEVRVIRTFILPSQSISLVSRLGSYLSFVLSSLITGVFVLPRVDFLLTESPPLILGFAGFILGRLKRAKWIFNVSDLWPESAVRLGVLHEGLVLKLGQKLEAFCYQTAWIVTGQSRTIVENIIERFPSLKTYHLSNGVDTSLFTPEVVPLEIWKEKDDKLFAVYAGLHGLAQGLDQILRAAPIFIAKIHFIFIGDGPTKKNLLSMKDQLNLTNVTFLPPMNKVDVSKTLAAADICIVPLKTYLPGAVPSKMYEAMASGKAILLIAEGEAAEIIEKNHAGVVVKPGDEAGLERALDLLASDAELRSTMGRAGREAALSKYDRQSIIDQFLSFLQSA